MISQSQNQNPRTKTMEEERRHLAPLRGDSRQAAQPIGLQCRYALELAALNGQGSEDKVSVAAALLALVPQLPRAKQEEALQQLLTMTQAIKASEVGNENGCSDEVADLAMLLLKRGQPQEAFVLARTISPQQAQEAGVFGQIVTSLIPSLSDGERYDFLQETWAVLRAQPERDLGGLARLMEAGKRMKAGYSTLQVEVLSALIPYLSASQQNWLLEETFTALRAVPYDELRVASHEALRAHRVILGYAKSRAEVLAALLPHLPAQEQRLAMLEGFAYIRAIPYIGSRVEALTALFAYLPAYEQQVALEELLYTIEYQKIGQAKLLSSPPSVTCLARHDPHNRASHARQ
jgi:hypothetical protein